MITYEHFKSTAKLRATTRDCPYLLALSIALFETGPQNRVRAAIFATQRRSTTRFQIYIPPFNELVFIFFNSSKKTTVYEYFMNSAFYSSTSFQKQPNTHQCNILTIALRSNALGKNNTPSVLFTVRFMGTAPP